MVVLPTHESRILENNPLGDSSARTIPVYLPPDYETSAERYPVVYFLAGFSGGGTLLLNESMWGETLPQRIDRLMRTGKIDPIIVVMADCRTKLGGSQYINSVATGRYEEYIVDELVPWVDATYRTIAERDSRAVMGKSSGGYGATVLAMRHTDRFGLAVDHSGDKYFDFCYRADIPTVVSGLGRYQSSAAEFLREFPHPAESRGRQWFTIVNMLAMASCYSPNPDSPTGFDLPFDERTGELRPDVWQRWLAHDPVELAARHADSLRSLRLFYLDCGSWDEHHLQLGNRIFSQRLKALDVPHTYEEFDGGHMNVAHRYEHSLQLISETLRSS
jgi:enterochelin esterase-like enzyme